MTRSPRAARCLALLAGLTLLAPAAADGDGADALRPGPWKPRRTPDGWALVRSKHGQVQSQAGEALGETLAAHLERVLPACDALLSGRGRAPDFVAKVFRDERAFRAYGGEGGAHYDHATREIVAWDTGLALGALHGEPVLRLDAERARDLAPDDRREVEALLAAVELAQRDDVGELVAHEGWPLSFHYATVSWVPVPLWLDEGLADDVAARHRPPRDAGDADVAEGGADDLADDLRHDHLRTLRDAFDDGTTLPLRALLALDRDAFYARAPVSYAQAWSLVRFLRTHEDADLRRVVPAALADFLRSKDGAAATERAFADVDLDALDDAWIRWVLRQEVHDPLRELARRFGRRLRPDDLVGPAAWKDRYARLRRQETRPR